MAMFDIKDSKGVILNANKTNQADFAKVRNVDGFSATENQAGSESSKSKDEVFEMKPGVFGFRVNLKALWRRLFCNS